MRNLSKFGKKIVVIATLFIVAVLAFAFTFVKIPTGYTGILTTFGKVEDVTFEAGGHFKSPFQSVVKMDNREQREQITTLAFTKDTQEVKIVYSVNYQVDKATAMNLYRNIGASYFNTLIYPRLTEAIKNSIKVYTADALIQNRGIVSSAVLEELKEDLDGYGVSVIGVFIEDLDFSDAYTSAVEAKQVADQTRLKNAIEQEQLTNEARQKAERDVIQADAELTKTKKAAEADAYAIEQKATAEAEANHKLAESITPELVSYLEVQRWNGVRVMTINGATPLIQVPQSGLSDD